MKARNGVTVLVFRGYSAAGMGKSVTWGGDFRDCAGFFTNRCQKPLTSAIKRGKSFTVRYLKNNRRDSEVV
jgi:hypothetical protein